MRKPHRQQLELTVAVWSMGMLMLLNESRRLANLATKNQEADTASACSDDMPPPLNDCTEHNVQT
ncbi:hypothetical protein HUB94_03165 [Paenibacillus cellulosilyticus]|uniref:hypothetical protein n=1 Tax=Paenibacillus cellulosilyticus TaxID=375489 RepID=UPI000D712608|nr:hypothetical protein [Paenibacillus cellulosilyticus]QKS43545.1 hypothetical protein HUB94_03165 [Paenibacillus cellulosilyticus]